MYLILSQTHRARVVVAFDTGPAIQDLRVAFGDCLMQRQHVGIHFLLRPGFRLEMPVSVLATHQAGAVVAEKLAYMSRDIADCESDAAVVRGIGRRAMHQPHMVQRGFAWFEVEPDSLRLVHLDRNFLATGQQVVLGERVAMRDLLELMAVRD